MDVQSVAIKDVCIPEKRQRAYSEDKARELAQDIHINGLLHPITVIRYEDGTLDLVAGLHRLRGQEFLGYEEIDANVLDFANSTIEEIKTRALMIEVSENLNRKDLSVVELSKHAVAYEICYEELGYKKGPGRPSKRSSSAAQAGEEIMPGPGTITPMGNKEFAHLIGKGTTQYRALKQIRTRIPDTLLSKLEGTAVGSSQEELRRLGKRNLLEQIKITALIKSGEAQNVRDAQRSLERAQARSLTQETETPNGTYRTIVIDPPWDSAIGGDVDPFGKIAPAYPTMTYEELEALPVSDYADEDGCHLYLWYTARTAEAAFKLVRSYGFRPITNLVWDKVRPGTGHWFRMRHEMILFCVKGNMPLACRDYDSVIREQRRRHSEKPQKFYEVVRECSPGPRLELFARTKREGFISFGTLEYESEDALTAL